MPWKSVVLAVTLVLGPANMSNEIAFGRDISGGGGVRHFHRNSTFRNGSSFRRNFATGGLWPYYDDPGPTDAYDDDTTTYPTTVGVVPEPKPAPVCHHSEEIVKVPAEGGETRQIKIIRCP
jgi:hypothetical protein